jgi:hypothetical protein
MTMAGPVEEGAKVASGIVDALKAQPAVLALTLANFALLVFIFYALHQAASYRQKMLDQVFENGRELQQLLSRCRVTELDEQPRKSTEVVIEPLKPLE